MLHGCYTGVTMLLHHCYTIRTVAGRARPTLVLHDCFIVFMRLLHLTIVPHICQQQEG
jgi:hypothetical protein